MAIIPIHPVGGAPRPEDDAQAATQFFSNYSQLKTRVPMAVW